MASAPTDRWERDGPAGPAPAQPAHAGRGLLGWWNRVPLYLRILVALVLGVVVGLVLGPNAGGLRQISNLVLQLLRALAVPLIMVAIVNSLLSARITGRTGRQLIQLLVTNMLVAVLIGLAVTNVLQPGRLAQLPPPAGQPEAKPLDPWQTLSGMLPASVLGPLVDNNIIPAIVIALAAGLALRTLDRTVEAGSPAAQGLAVTEQVLATAFQALLVMLHWILAIIPLAVFGVIASVVGTQGFAPFVALGAFVGAVLVALALMVVFYLVRVSLQSWVRPGAFLRGGFDALATAFSTASSAVTMPVTFECLTEEIGVRRESASLGVFVGSPFNHDGTALYEGMAALFISQAIGQHLDLPTQVLLVFLAMLAAEGAPGIPDAGLVTMLLVFSAVRLPVEYVPLLLTVDWFLDRCRTMVNVMGDLTVSSILDGRERHDPDLLLPPSVGQAVPARL
jgi:Na+/H+-dicarboxylate symporter